MNWYNKKVFKFSSALGKIKQYKIVDPAIKAFIYKYENSGLIQWKDIKNEQDIQSSILKLLPGLKDSINPQNEKSYYMKDIDLDAELANNPDNPQIQAAYEMYRQDPDAAKEQILQTINGAKEKSFTAWWEYLTQENDIYANNPAFIYLLFKPILNTSDASTKTAPPGLNAIAVASVWQKIQTEPDETNPLKTYFTELAKTDTKSSNYSAISEESGWVRIPSKNNDPEHFEENIDKLSNFSIPNNWCTGSGMARPYLSGGDFWLFVENGVAKVAIRCEDENNQVAEIQGSNNHRPFEYWNEIEGFLSRSNIRYKDTSHYRELLRVKNENDKLATGDPVEINKYKDMIKHDPASWNRLTPENKKKFPEFKNIAIQISSKHIKELYYSNVKPDGSLKKDKYDEYRANYIETPDIFYNSLPKEIKRDLPQDTKALVFKYTKKILYENPYMWKTFPNDIKSQIGVKDAANAWIRFIKTNPSLMLEIDNLTDKNLKNEMFNNPQRAEQLKKIVMLSLNDRMVGNFDYIWQSTPIEIKNIITDKEKKQIADVYTKHFSNMTYHTIGMQPLIPEDLKQYFTKEGVASMYSKYVSDFGTKVLEDVPPDIKPLLNTQQIVKGIKDRIAVRPDYYMDKTIPEKYRKLIPMDFVLKSLRDRLQEGHLEWNTMVGDEVSKSITDMGRKLLSNKELGQIYKNYLFNMPLYAYNVPDDIKKYITLDFKVKSWDNYFMKYVKQSKGQYDFHSFDHTYRQNVPKEVKPLLSQEIKNILSNTVNEHIIKNPNIFYNLKAEYGKFIRPETIEKVKEYYDQIVGNYTDNYSKYVPDELKEQIYLKHRDKILKAALYTLRSNGAHYFIKDIDPKVQKDLIETFPNEVSDALAQELSYNPVNYGNLNNVLKSLVPNDIKQKVVQFYKPYIGNLRTEKSFVPEDIKLILQQEQIQQPTTAINKTYFKLIGNNNG